MTFSRTCLTASLVFIFGFAHCQAGEVLQAHVDYEQGHYLINLEMRIAAPRARVDAVLHDFNHLGKINNSIKQSRLLSHHQQQYTVSLESEACIWIYCKRIHQVQVITDLANGYMKSITDPTQSDMASGRVLWHVRPDPQQAQQTLITYSADFEPDFFIPPLIGPWLLKKRLYKEAVKTVDGIERQARHERR